ncbi:alpha/beta hydrolase [Nocardia sp. NPDC003482]
MSTENIERVGIKALAWDIAADIHYPPGFDPGHEYTTIITAHPTGSCKEQTSGEIYAPALAREGFVAVAFDASFQGDSGGEPRLIEDPAFRVQDFSWVIDYLVTQPWVDENRIGVLAICGSGGYAVSATMTERRIKALGTVTGANVGRRMREGFTEYDPLGALEAMATQRTAEARGAEGQVNDLLPPSPEAARQAGLTDVDLVEATEYYKTDRGRKPHGLTSFLFSRQATLVGWDAFDRAEVLLTQPLCIVVGDRPGAFGAYRDAYELYGRAASSDKELVVLEGVSHYELYDKPEPVRQALDHLVPFFKKHL